MSSLQGSDSQADHLTISGMSGGTGAAKWGSIKHCGTPAAVHAALVGNPGVEEMRKHRGL